MITLITFILIIVLVSFLLLKTRDKIKGYKIKKYNDKDIGIIFILVGTCVSFVFFFLSSGYTSRYDLVSNIGRMGFYIFGEELPYEYILAIGIISIFIGIGKIILNSNEKENPHL